MMLPVSHGARSLATKHHLALEPEVHGRQDTPRDYAHTALAYPDVFHFANCWSYAFASSNQSGLNSS